MQTLPKTGVRGPGQTTREDWLKLGLETLTSQGVHQVKILVLASQLNCPRSSFYWFFKSRSELLDALLAHWKTTNTKALIDATRLEGDTICAALAKLYDAWVLSATFDTKLDFAIRDWARSSEAVRGTLDTNDMARVHAIAAMFQRFGYSLTEADARARIVYFTQIGYATLDQRESRETRVSRGATYLYCMTGQQPTEAEVNEITALPHISLQEA